MKHFIPIQGQPGHFICTTKKHWWSPRRLDVIRFEDKVFAKVYIETENSIEELYENRIR